MSLFGGFGNQNNAAPPAKPLWGASTTTNNQQPGGLFSLGANNTQNQPQAQTGLSSFGQPQQNQPQAGSSLFGQPQPQQSTAALFQSSAQPPALGMSLWSNVNSPQERSVPDQIKDVMESWDTGNPNCKFKTYFYNKADEGLVPLYAPSNLDNRKDWEAALAAKPSAGFIPVLCAGFAQIGQRITTQQQMLSAFNTRLHQINSALTEMLRIHDTQTSIRALDARRKHMVLKQRCLALATKVQVLRNRGYAMSGDEEDLKAKLMALDRGVSDPGLNARAEEIWARMITVQERARLLKAEVDKSGAQSAEILDDGTDKRAKKILEDYHTQLVHLKKELEKIQQDYVEWESAQEALQDKVNGR